MILMRLFFLPFSSGEEAEGGDVPRLLPRGGRAPGVGRLYDGGGHPRFLERNA